MKSSQNPQNPYGSFLVPASAGSGKTFQLSRRFLALVAAHAAPSQILTVTFTNKAAGEMRARILETAATLIVDPKAQKDFDASMAAFYAPHVGRFAPPLSAEKVGRIILASSQLLKISTIDSLFLEWVSKFPCEANGPTQDSQEVSSPSDSSDRNEKNGQKSNFPSPFRLADPLESREFDDLAWKTVCYMVRAATDPDLAASKSAVASLWNQFTEQDLERIEKRLKALQKEDTFLWYAEEKHGIGQGFFPLSMDREMRELAQAGDRELLERLSPSLLAIADKISNPTRKSVVIESIRSGDLTQLMESGLIAKSTGQLSGSLIRQNIRNALAREVLEVDTILGRYLDAKKIDLLNREGLAYYILYQAFRDARDSHKFGDSKVEFKDLAKGAYRLFYGDAGAGVRFLLSRTVQHLMLDEFQDTSRLQWSIFSELSLTLLSMEEQAGAAPPSVFIVGDTKQSIYGFREADPSVMKDAGRNLDSYISITPMSTSYRTAQLVLDFVNAVFGRSGIMPEYQTHTTACIHGEPVVPNLGRILLAPLTEDTDEKTAIEQEAELVAFVLDQALSGKMACPVPVKNADGAMTMRPLRPGDCAILYRSSTHAGIFERALRRRGIPCQREEERGFFSRPEISDTVALMTFLCTPSDLVALGTVLKSPFIQLSDTELLAIFSQSIDASDGDGHANRHLRILDLAAASLPKKIQMLKHLKDQADKVLPHVLLTESMRAFDGISLWLEVFREEPGEAQVARANLLRLIEVTMTLERQGYCSLDRLLDRLALLAEDDEVGNASTSEHAVTLMTIHKSKGLEFPWVTVVDTGRAYGQQDPYWVQQDENTERSLGLTYIGTKAEQPVFHTGFERVFEATEEKIKEESLRLLYVALTRAKHYLFVSGHKSLSQKGLKGTAPYSLLEEGFANLDVPLTKFQAHVGSKEVFIWDKGVEAKGFSEISGYGELNVLAGDSLTNPENRIPSTRPTPMAAWKPVEWRIRSPSKHDDERSSLSTDYLLEMRAWPVPVLSPIYGAFIHKGLEAFLKGVSFEPARIWSKLAPLRYRHMRYAEEAIASLNFAKEDSLWNTLREQARHIFVEYPVVALHPLGETLLNGTIDALFELVNGEYLLLDHKTTRFQKCTEDISDDDLRAFSRARRWDQQLRDYGRFVKGLAPGKKVTSAIYFTSLRRLVSLTTD